MSILTESLARQTIEAVKQTGMLISDPTGVNAVTAKNPTDFVTNVDLAVQHTLRSKLEALAPEVQFLGEEGERTPIDYNAPFWILDPVDGTTNLIHQFQHSAISLALVEHGQVVFGLVHHPYTLECFTAQRGGGAFRNGHPIRVSSTSRLADSLLSVGTVPGRRDLADQAFHQMRLLYDRCQDVRRTGCASLDLCWVACGRLDGYVELALQPWDYAAGLLLVEEAGGRITTPDGQPLSLTEGCPVLASNQILHPQLMDTLNG